MQFWDLIFEMSGENKISNVQFSRKIIRAHICFQKFFLKILRVGLKIGFVKKLEILGQVYCAKAFENEISRVNNLTPAPHCNPKRKSLEFSFFFKHYEIKNSVCAILIMTIINIV